jgi:hypothetical protein
LEGKLQDKIKSDIEETNRLFQGGSDNKNTGTK